MSETIYITSHDKKQLKALLTTQISSEEALGPYVRKLEDEISKAAVIQPEQADPDLVTMNSRVLLALDDADMDLWLVYPAEADINENKVSVLSPIGTAILGYSKGDVIRWDIPAGVAEITIKEILYQPESAWEDQEEETM
jgi:regulator of nucleoside diphosphate kinase